VSLPVMQRFRGLAMLVGDLDASKLYDSLEMVKSRLEYVEYFARTMDNVPAQLPYENGKLWLGAIKHVLMPRVFFPNKEELHDSYRTQKYAGVAVAGPDEGTSIGIGYMAECYIDFGPYLMFVPVLLIGFGYGLIYRYFVYGCTSRALGFSLAVGILYVAHQDFGMAEAKLLGGNLVAFIVLYVFAKFFGRRVMAWLSAPVGTVMLGARRVKRTRDNPGGSAPRQPTA
jgi:hypothetical protein